MKRPSREERAVRRRALEARRDALRARIAKRRPARPVKKRRRWWLLVLILLLLLLLLRRCSCSPPPEEEVRPAAPVPTGPAAPDPEPPVPPGPAAPRLPRTDRPSYKAEVPQTPPWLDAFRLQVAARSPRLATCFEGSARPGRYRWTTSVEPRQGTVSAHELEPVLETDSLPREQQTCVLAVLSDPPYRLPTGDEASTPARVGLVIEF